MGFSGGRLPSKVIFYTFAAWKQQSDLGIPLQNGCGFYTTSTLLIPSLFFDSSPPVHLPISPVLKVSSTGSKGRVSGLSVGKWFSSSCLSFEKRYAKSFFLISRWYFSFLARWADWTSWGISFGACWTSTFSSGGGKLGLGMYFFLIGSWMNLHQLPNEQWPSKW